MRQAVSRKILNAASSLGLAFAFVAAAFADVPTSLGFVETGRTVLGIRAPAQSRFAIADLDGDGLQDVVFCGVSSGSALFVVGHRPDGTVDFKLAKTVPDDGGIARVFASDTNGRRHVYTVTYDGIVRDFSGWPLEQVDSFALGTNLITAAIGDLYGDGGSDLVALTSDYVYAYSLDTQELLWSYPVSAAQDIAIAQLDADPGLEIVVTASPSVVIDAATQSPDWLYVSALGFGSYITTGHFNGDSTTQFVGAAGTSFTVFRGAPWSPLWSAASVPGGISALAAANLDNNNHDVILEGDSQWGTINAFDSSTHQLRFKIDNPGWGVNALTSADIDGDGVPEIVFASAGAYPSSLEVVDSRSGQIKWVFTPGEGPFSPVAVGDVDGDGHDELVVADRTAGSNSLIRVFDAATGVFEWQWPSGGNGGAGYLYPSRVLLRPHAMDPAMDIVLAGTSSYDGHVVWLDGATRTLEFQVYGYGTGPLASRSVMDAALVDYDNDGTLDVALASALGAGNSLLQVLSGTDGHELWASPQMASANPGINSVLVVGSPSDASGELIAVLPSGLTAYNIQDPSSIWTLLADADGATYIPQGLEGPEFALFQKSGAVTFYDAVTRANLRSFTLPSPLNALLPVSGSVNLLLAASADRVVLVESDHGDVRASSRQLGQNLATGNQLAYAALADLEGRVVAGDEFGVTRLMLQMVPDRVFAGNFEDGN